MKNLLAGQVRLGNVFLAENNRGELVQRRLVGGQFGSVTKYFTIDEESKLKSNARGTIEEVLEGYEIKSIASYGLDISGMTIVQKEDIEDLVIKRGLVLGVLIEGELVYRELVGGKQFDTTAWFAIDPATGERKSKTTYENSREVLESYEDNLQFVLV